LSSAATHASGTEIEAGSRHRVVTAGPRPPLRPGRDPGAASDIYESRREPLDQLVSQITPLPDQVGAAFIVRGRLVGAELFDSPRSCDVPPFLSSGRV
jgi:hypothetical protein